MRHAALYTILISMMGCATTPNAPKQPTEKKLPAGIYHLRTGKFTTQEQLITRLMRAEFIVIGEQHTDPQHHKIQLKIIDELHKRQKLSKDKRTISIGMEMFQQPFQSVLDDYVAGRITETQMLTKTEYAKRWGFNTALYAPLWQYAKTNNLPLFALNAPTIWTKQTAKVGLDKLDPAIKSQLPEMDLSDWQHRRWMKEIFKAHGSVMEDHVFERFYQAQVIWDETMANNAVRGTRERKDVAKIVVLAGSGHVLQRFGIPKRISRRTKHYPVTIIPITRKKPFTPKALKAYDDKRYADYIWVSYASK